MDTRLGDVGIVLDVEAEYSVVDLARLVETLDRETFRRALVRHGSGAEVLAAPARDAARLTGDCVDDVEPETEGLETEEPVTGPGGASVDVRIGSNLIGWGGCHDERGAA